MRSRNIATDSACVRVLSPVQMLALVMIRSAAGLVWEKADTVAKRMPSSASRQFTAEGSLSARKEKSKTFRHRGTEEAEEEKEENKKRMGEKQKTNPNLEEKREVARERKPLANCVLLLQRFVLTTFTADLKCAVAIGFPR